jgi:hypothetical protein
MSCTSRHRGTEPVVSAWAPRGETVMGHARRGGQASDEASGAATGPTPAIPDRQLQGKDTAARVAEVDVSFRVRSVTADASLSEPRQDDSRRKSHSASCWCRAGRATRRSRGRAGSRAGRGAGSASSSPRAHHPAERDPTWGCLASYRSKVSRPIHNSTELDRLQRLHASTLRIAYGSSFVAFIGRPRLTPTG